MPAYVSRNPRSQVVVRSALVCLLATFGDWLIHASEDVHDDLRAFLPERPHRVDELITYIGTTTVLIRAGHDSQLAWTPC
jgi:hypothetical protein